MTAAPRPAALILAGGGARRLGGGDKPLSLLAGEPMLARILRVLGPQADPIALSANGDPARFAAFGLPVLPDPDPPGPAGPLAGILAGMRWAAGLGHHRLLTVPGDTPFLPADLAAQLGAAARPGTVAVAQSDGRLHPVVALWPADLAGDLAAFLADGDRRGVAAFAGRRQVAVSWPMAQAGAVAYDPFLNVNTPADLAQAEAVARELAA